MQCVNSYKSFEKHELIKIFYVQVEYDVLRYSIKIILKYTRKYVDINITFYLLLVNHMVYKRVSR